MSGSYRHERAAEDPAAVLAAEIGVQVRRARRELGLDQATTALLAGVSERFLREVEHGKETVQLKQLVAVLDTVGLRLRLVDDDG